MGTIFTLFTVVYLGTFSSYGQVKYGLDTIDYNLFKSYNVDYKGLSFLGRNNFSYTPINNVETSNNTHINSSFFSLANLEKKQSSKDIYSNFNRTVVPKIDDKWNFDFNLRNVNRMYYKPNYFYEINPNLSAFLPIFNTIKNNVSASDYYLNLSSAIDLRVGIGRINPTSEVFTVAFIIDELKKEGIDVSKLGQDEVFEFGQVLVGIRNKRILDSRRAAVQSFLEMNKFLNKYISTNEDEKMIASAIILDNIFFVYGPPRSSGQRFSIGIQPNVKYILHSPSPFNGNGYSLIGTFDNQYSKALSRYINFNYHINFGPSYIAKNQVNSSRTFNFYALLSTDISYYPNSRTEVTSGINVSKYEGENKNLSFTTKADYFINYFTNLQLFLQYSIATKNQFIFNVELRHAMF